MVRRRHSQPVGEDSKPVAVRYPPAPKQFFETAWDTPGEPDAYPATLNLSTNLIERVAGFLLHVANTPGSDWSRINTELQQAAQNVAYELIRAKELQIIGADDADADPTLDRGKIVVYAPGDPDAPVGLSPTAFITQYHPSLITNSSAPYLIVTFTPDTGRHVDLTAEGITDWRHYGNFGASARKATGPNVLPSISGIEYDGAASDTTFVWSDGTPITDGYTDSLLYGDSFGFALPANEIPRHYRIYIGGSDCTSQFMASLADSSAPPYSDEAFTAPAGPDDANGYYDIYVLAGSTTTVSVSFVKLSGGNIQVRAITLHDGADAVSGGGSIDVQGLDDAPVSSEDGSTVTSGSDGTTYVQRVAPTPSVSVSLNGVDGDITDNTVSNHRHRAIALAYTPPVIPVTPPPPCNCDTGGSKPPPTPPAPPPDIPSPTPPSKQSWACTDLINDGGVGVTVTVAGVVGVGAKYYDQDNTAIATGITTILTAELSPALQAGDVVQSLDMRCDAIVQISPFSLIGMDGPIISRPVIRKIDGDSTIDYYYFVRAKTEALFPGPLIHDVYDGHPETVTVGRDGYADWVFDTAYFECEIARAFTNLEVQVCGATVHYWEPLFYYRFDGSEQVLADGMHDAYDNYVVPFSTSAFLDSRGFPVSTDQVHGFNLNFTPIDNAPLRAAATTAVISGHIKAVPGGLNNDCNIRLQILDDFGTVIATSANQFVSHTDDIDFSLTATGTFNSGTEYIFALRSDSFPAMEYFLTNVRGALS